MDYRVKVVNVPSVTDAVAKHNRTKVNGLRFGWSDKLDAVVSEPASEAQVRSFRKARGYHIVDAVNGDLISTPDPVTVQTQSDDDGDDGDGEASSAQPQQQVQRDPNKVWVEDFLQRFEAASPSQRQRFNKDELTRALRTLQVNVGPDATKKDLVAMVEQVLAERSQTPAPSGG